MKQNPAVALAFLALLLSCSPGGNDQKKSNVPDCTIVNQRTVDSTGASILTADTIKTCFRFDKGEMHHWIAITRVNDSAWGTLHYNYEGKDGANGDFTGNFAGDTLRMLYNGVMEGNLIPREVIFVVSGDKLHEAQGMQEEDQNGVYRYQHKKLLEFNDPNAMVKGSCM